MAEVYGVFEGGGVRGTALVGAVAAVEERHMTFRAVAGTSAGAIVAALVAAGYNAESIPFFFRPVRFGSELMVDGGVLSNFPAWAFDAEQKTAPLPILGLRLQPDDVPPARIANQLDLAKALLATVMRAGVELQIAKEVVV